MKTPTFACALAAVVLSATALAQPSPAPRPEGAPRPEAAPRPEVTPAPRSDARRTYTFQLVLLTAELDGPAGFEHVPANARKALEDVRTFLPYKSYHLLDMAWMRSSGYAEAQLSGPDGVSFSTQIRFRASSDEPGRIDIQRFVLVSPQPLPKLLGTPPAGGAATAIAPAPPIRPVLESSFGMKAGETVVVGTAKLDGPSRALVVILTALP